MAAFRNWLLPLWVELANSGLELERQVTLCDAVTAGRQTSGRLRPTDALDREHRARQILDTGFCDPVGISSAKEDESTAYEKAFVQEQASKKFARLYTEEDIDKEFDARIENGTGTTLNPYMYYMQVAELEVYKSGKNKGQIKIFRDDSGN